MDKRHPDRTDYIEFREIAIGLKDDYFTSNRSKLEGVDTIGGRVCHFQHNGQKFTRMRQLLASILSIDFENDISKDEDDFPFLRKQTGSCKLHCDSIDKKQKGMCWYHPQFTSILGIELPLTSGKRRVARLMRNQVFQIQNTVSQ